MLDNNDFQKIEEKMDVIWKAYSPDIRAGLAGKEVKRGSGRLKYLGKSIHPGRDV